MNAISLMQSRGVNRNFICVQFEWLGLVLADTQSLGFARCLLVVFRCTVPIHSVKQAIIQLQLQHNPPLCRC